MDDLDRFMSAWQQMQQNQHSRLLQQLKRELMEIRSATASSKSSSAATLPPDQTRDLPFPAAHRAAPLRSGQPPRFRTASPKQQVTHPQ